MALTFSSTTILAGLTVAQISEFSLILAALGFQLGHLERDVVGVVTLVGLVTISVSTYMILYSQQLYRRLERWLAPFERRIAYAEAVGAADAGGIGPDVVPFGLGRFGTNIARELDRRGVTVLAVEADPDRIRAHRGERQPAVQVPAPYPRGQQEAAQEQEYQRVRVGRGGAPGTATPSSCPRRRAIGVAAGLRRAPGAGRRTSRPARPARRRRARCRR